ncbi:MAG: shikimate kinase [Sphaerochaetaceae bacterium]
MINSNLFLCGIKHCGKSSLGKVLAKAWNRPWFDADDLIRQCLGPEVSIRTYYQKQGLRAFQSLECQTLEKALNEARVFSIFSLGGGACDNPKLLEMVNGRGVSIYLRVSEQVLLKRIMKDGIPPFLDKEDPQTSFAALYARRDKLYGKKCAFVIDLPDYPTVEETSQFFIKYLEGVSDGPQQLRN